MTTRTGATLGNFDVIEQIEPIPRERHTCCVIDQVDNPSLRAAMSLFDDSLVAGPRSLTVIVTGGWDVGKSALLGAVASALRESARSLEPVLGTSAHKVDDVVEVVRDLQHRLGIDLKDVLAAAGIKPRTYHSWAQPSAPRPRLASQGQLWALAQLVDDLPELLNVPLRQWILAEPDRLTALRTGRFDELLEQATHERIQKDPAGTVAGPFHGVGDDSPLSPPTTNRLLVVDEQAITEPPPPSRGSPGLPPT